MNQETTTDPDIMRAARHMIDRHGVYAVYYAAIRAEELSRDNAPRAALLWDRVALAILAINAAPRGSAPRQHSGASRRQARG